jgi:hypothetical protein
MVSRGTAHGILHVGTVKVGQIEVPYYSVDSAHIMLLKVQGTSKNKRVRLAKVFPNDGGKTQTQSEIYKAPKNERNYLNTVSPSFFSKCCGDKYDQRPSETTPACPSGKPVPMDPPSDEGRSIFPAKG